MICIKPKSKKKNYFYSSMMDTILFIYTSLIAVIFPPVLEPGLALQVSCFESPTAHGNSKVMYDSRTDALCLNGYFKLILF